MAAACLHVPSAAIDRRHSRPFCSAGTRPLSPSWLPRRPLPCCDETLRRCLLVCDSLTGRVRRDQEKEASRRPADSHTAILCFVRPWNSQQVSETREASIYQSCLGSRPPEQTLHREVGLLSTVRDHRSKMRIPFPGDSTRILNSWTFPRCRVVRIRSVRLVITTCGARTNHHHLVSGRFSCDEARGRHGLALPGYGSNFMLIRCFCAGHNNPSPLLMG